MKKIVVIGLSLLAMAVLGSSLAMAYDAPDSTDTNNTPAIQGRNFVDQDGDGVCDLAGTRQGFGPNGRANGECGENFIDQDGDGICDLAGTGQGFGPYSCTDGECGPNFVDEDGDGQCDLMGTGQGFGSQGRMGNGQGRGWGRIAQGGGFGN